MRYIGIETFSPAEITYPADVKKILIVNNAVPQPPDAGYDYNLLGTVQDTCQAHADSALFQACKSLGNAIVETDFFQDVLLFHENTRRDTAFLLDKRLTQEEVISLCNETGADAVISLDRLLFTMSKIVVKGYEGFLFGSIEVKATGVVRSFLPSRESPQTTIMFEDSVFWVEEAPNLQILDKLFPTPDEALITAGDYIGNKIYTVFVPHWERDTRWYYTGSGSRWKEASSYAANEKWENAYERWIYIFERSSSWKSKAKLASNIALYFELNGDMNQAVEWAEKSSDLFKDNSPEDDRNRVLQEAYKTQLIERIQADKKLNLQFGDE